MNKPLIAFIIGLLLALVLSRMYSVFVSNSDGVTSHPIGYANSPEEVHVHSDFLVYLDGQLLDFSQAEYQTTSTQSKHAHIHLHDNNGDIIHRHDHDITLADFFTSLGFTLSDECISTDTGSEFCTNEDAALQLYINGEPTTTIASYVNQEEDRLLLYYGDPTSDVLPSLLQQITDTACIYSGTCPERGTAPAEECGLTCEL